MEKGKHVREDGCMRMRVPCVRVDMFTCVFMHVFVCYVYCAPISVQKHSEIPSRKFCRECIYLCVYVLICELHCVAISILEAVQLRGKRGHIHIDVCLYMHTNKSQISACQAPMKGDLALYMCVCVCVCINVSAHTNLRFLPAKHP